MNKSFLSLIGVLILTAAGADSGSREVWLVDLEAQRLGPVQFHLTLRRDGSHVRGQTTSGLLKIAATQQDDGSYLGEARTSESMGTIHWQVENGVWQGKLELPSISGKFSAEPARDAGQLREFAEVLEVFDIAVAANIYSPAELDTTAYREFRKEFEQVAKRAYDDLDLLLGFREARRAAPFSHFDLRRSHQSAAEMFTYFDAMRVGFESATVEFDGDVAVLKVRTMMGADTIEQIQAAYAEIDARQPATLIIDLRGNRGGAFAVKPLVEHVIDEPLDAGYFLSQVWNRDNSTLPSKEQVLATDPWDGWSLIAFWNSVKEAELLRVQFQPATPNFDGEVFVLLDSAAESATEMAADALSSSGLATVVGQPSGGKMLSQSMFDLNQGFVVAVPVADYYSFTNGRIEGNGVAVDVPVEPELALERAKQIAQ